MKQAKMVRLQMELVKVGKNYSRQTSNVVRDFALQLELKPFKLISELMELGIFASMNQTIEESVALELAKRHGFN